MDNAKFDNSISVLIQKIRNENDESAFTLIYERYRTPLFHYIKVIDIHLSDDTVFDLIQDIFIKVYKYIKGLKDPDKFEHWLFKIAKNTLYNFAKKNKHTIKNPTDSTFINIKSPNILENYLLSIKRYEILNDFMRTLPAFESIIFLKRALEDENLQKIAQDLKKTPRQIQYRLKGIYKKLKKFFKNKKINYEDLGEI